MSSGFAVRIKLTSATTELDLEYVKGFALAQAKHTGMVVEILETHSGSAWLVVGEARPDLTIEIGGKVVNAGSAGAVSVPAENTPSDQ